MVVPSIKPVASLVAPAVFRNTTVTAPAGRSRPAENTLSNEGVPAVALDGGVVSNNKRGITGDGQIVHPMGAVKNQPGGLTCAQKRKDMTSDEPDPKLAANDRNFTPKGKPPGMSTRSSSARSEAPGEGRRCEGAVEVSDGATQIYSPAEPQDVVLTPCGGVRKRVLQAAPEGALAPEWGSLVEVHFTGRFPNGTVFDAKSAEVPFEFQLNAGVVVDGMQKGVESMRVAQVI